MTDEEFRSEFKKQKSNMISLTSEEKSVLVQALQEHIEVATYNLTHPEVTPAEAENNPHLQLCEQLLRRLRAP